MKKIVLGLSGGVDSAVAANMLIHGGFEPTGVFLCNGSDPGDAERAARELGIDFLSVDISRELEEKVVGPFVETYLRGETPSPCIVCNPEVKFRALIAAADRLGADFVATGHYARAAIDPATGRGLLLRGHPGNDQSYMLYRLTPDTLSRAVFPLGGQDKAATRAQAKELGLSCAKKPDSMEICFVQNGRYREFIERRAAADRLPLPGNFVDTDGRILGEHRGIHAYTVGQRRHLGISAENALYVGAIRPENNEVVLMKDSQLYKRHIHFRDTHMIVNRGNDFDAEVKIRHSRREACGHVSLSGDGGDILFSDPVRAPAPGQSAVFYDGDLVLGGGFIASSDS